MKDLVNFLIEIGKLKKTKRRGWVLRGMRDSETIAAHTFRMAIMAWFLGKQKKLDMDKVIKMSLIHDLCEVYAGDATPYDKILPKNKKELKKMFDNWPRSSKKEKEKKFFEKYKKENQALEKLILKLPSSLKKEVRDLWSNYENGLTKEGRFVRQVDRVENLLQALEYRKEGERFSIEPWWIQIEELVDIPILVKFIKILDKKFSKKR